MMLFFIEEKVICLLQQPKKMVSTNQTSKLLLYTSVWLQEK